jgi:hypothetical protein
LLEEELIMRLENGHATIKAFMFSANIIFKKEVLLKGMRGLKTIMTKTESNGLEFKNTMISINPSPVEIDLGTVMHEIRNDKGVKIAEQKGKVYLAHGESTYTMAGVTTGEAAEEVAMVIGLGVEEDNSNNSMVVHLNTAVTLTDEFVALCIASGKEEG